MGEVIAYTAATEAKLADAGETLTAAIARGGVCKEEAERRFSPTLSVVATIVARMDDARRRLQPLDAAADVADENVDALVQRIYDESWNAIGRPANDPHFTVLFASGAGGIVDDDREGQPARMELLATLLEARIHPRIPVDKAIGWATELRAGAGELKAKLDAARGPKAELAQLEKIRMALARSLRTELVRFKRFLAGEGFSEAEIHTVIPDRSRPGKPAAATPIPA